MLYLLDKDTKTVKWNGIPLHEAGSAVVKEETNGDFYLTVHYPITDSGIYQLIKEDMLIKAPMPVLGPQLFRIKKPVENDDSLDITAYHISDDVMQRSVKPVSVVGQGCAMALSQMVQNAKTGLGDFSFTSDIMDSRTFNTTETETLYSVLLDGKHSIVGTWEGELVRDNFALTIKRSRGADRGVVITTHKNLKSYQRTKNSQNVVTRIHARSTFRAEGAETDTVLTVTVDSPLIGNYPYINEKEYENNDAKTIDELKKWAEAKFKNEGIDKVSDAIEIEAYELDGQVVHLGDTVNIKSRKHDVDLYKKAIAYEFNALTEEYISITFDDKPGVGGSGVSSGVSNAADVILSANRNAQEVAIERAVKNANQAFDAEFDKRVEVINDGIEQAKAEAELYADTIKQSIDAKIDEVNTSMQAQSEEHDRQVADILSKTQSVEELANQAKTDAVNAINGTLEAKQLAQAAGGQISQVQLAVDEANRQILQRVTKAEFNPITQRLSSAETTILTQAGLIEQRLTSTQVNNLVDSKGYITSSALQPYALSTTVQNLVKETADSFSRTISETKALIPTDFSGGNLIRNSGFPTNTQYWSGQMIVSQHDFYYNGQKKLFSLQTTGTAEIFASSNRFEVKSNTNYTLSFYAFAGPNVRDSDIYFLGRKSNETNDFTSVNAIIFNRRFSAAKAEYVTVTFNSGDNDNGYIRFDNNGSTDGVNAVLFFGEVMLVEGTTPRKWEACLDDFVTEIKYNRVTDTVDSHTRTIGAVGETGSILDNVSKVTQTAAGLVTEVSGDNGLKTHVSQLAGSYAIKNLTKAGDVLGQINLNKDGSIKLDGSLVQITGKTYIQDGVISAAKIGDLDAGKITTGYLASARIATDSITGSHIAFDQAFFNSFMANEAYLKQIFAKNAFITSVQAVAISASNVTTGILRATNGALDIDLDNANITFNQNATINFNSDSNALVRKKGDVTAFVNFADDLVSGGVYAGFGVTSHAVGVTTADNSDRGKFAGMRVYRPNDSLDLVRLIGDTITLAHGTEGSYFSFNPSKLRNNVDMLKLAGAVYTLSRIFMHLSANGWAFDHPSFIAGVKYEMARNWLQDFANGGLPR